MLIDKLCDTAYSDKVNLYGICEYHQNQFICRSLCGANEKNNVYSVAKSVTALLTGILIEAGCVALTDTVASFFPDALNSRNSKRWEHVQLKHLLTHTTGFSLPFLDIDQDNVLPLGDDYLSAVFRVPLVYAPGEKMVYSDANYYLISRILSQRYGDTLHRLALDRLFNPMEIIGSAWASCPRGFSLGATGLYLSTEDMAKIGLLLLHNGTWKGRQLVPSDWVQAITKAHVRCDANTSYGYGFWLSSHSPAFWARGMLGQMIYVSPSLQSVVAWQGCCKTGGDDRLLSLLAKEEAALC